jgi:hypothetical protein
MSDERQWVVYAMGSMKFLAVCDSKSEAEEKGDKWWKAFDNGEKAKPKGYQGISWKPVADFEQWAAPEEM